MKRILAMLLALMMLFTLAACGGNTAPVEDTAAQEPAAEEPAAEAETPEEPAAETYEAYDVRSMAGQWEYHEVLNVGGESKYVQIPY